VQSFISSVFKSCIEMLIAEGKSNKVEDFADKCNMSRDVMKNIINNRKIIYAGDFRTIVTMIRKLSPHYAYRFLKEQLLGSPE